MNIRNLSLQRPLTPLVLLAALSLFSLPAPSPANIWIYPPPMPPATIAAVPLEQAAALAREVAENSELLVKRGYVKPFNHTGLEFQAIDYLERLTVTAAQFHREARLSPPDIPQNIAAMYQLLRQQYLVTQPFFEMLLGPPAVQAAMARLNGAMSELAALFGENLAAMTPPVGVVRQFAARMAERAGRLESLAAAEAAAGRVRRSETAVFGRISEAARRFSDRASVVHGDPTQLAADYGGLVKELLAARPVLTGFTLNFQGAYGELWHLTQDINFAGPQAAVGGGPYSYRFWQD